jgi:excisionase family DNA binding protein
MARWARSAAARGGESETVRTAGGSDEQARSPAPAEHDPVLPRLLTLSEVAGYLNVSPKTVRRLVASRRLQCVRLGRVLRFQPADLFRFVEARKE